MKVKQIKLIELIDSIVGEENYTYTSKYTRKDDNTFIPKYLSTSKTKLCNYCGDWIYHDKCECGNKITEISEKDVIELLEEALNNFDYTKIKINGVAIN